MRELKKIAAVVVGSAALATSVAVVAQGAETGDKAGPPPNTEPVASVPAREAADYAVLDRAQRQSDELPPDVRQLLADDPDLVTQWGVNIDLARRTGPTSWLLPGAGALCVVQLDNHDGTVGTVCNTAEVAAEQGLIAWTLHGSDSGVVAGVVPDQVDDVQLSDRSGDERSVDVQGNGFAAGFNSRTDQLSFVGADNQVQEEDRPSR
jgi:hypothetical protein